MNVYKFILKRFFFTEKSVIVEKIIENIFIDRRFTEIPVERNNLRIKDNLGISTKLQRLFAFQKISFLPDIEKVLLVIQYHFFT